MISFLEVKAVQFLQPFRELTKPKMKFPISIMALTGLWLLPLLALQSLEAQPLAEMSDWGPATFSFGGASAAMASNHDSLLTNPANLIYYSGKNSIGGSWMSLPSDMNHWSVSIVDGQSNILGGFIFQKADSGNVERQTYSAGFAYQTPYGAFGGTGQAIRFSGISPGKGWHFTSSLGVLVPVAWGIALAAYSKSLLDLEKSNLLPPSLHLAALYTYPERFRLSFESDRRFGVTNPKWNHSLGGDLLLAGYFAIRGGYRWDNNESASFWSTGAGVLAEKIEIVGTFVRFGSGKDREGFGVDVNLKF